MGAIPNQMVYTGPKPWHGVGFEVPVGTPFDEWIEKSGLDFKVSGSPVTFNVNGHTHSFEQRHVLFRTDSWQPLSVVSNKYKIHQPRDIIDFMRKAVENAGFEMETAGILFNGARIWALARTPQQIRIMGQDLIDPKLFLATSYDGSMATQASYTTVRTVCENTIALAYLQTESYEEGQGKVTVAHNQVFDAKDIANKMRIFEKGLLDFESTANKLADTPLQPAEAVEYFIKVFGNIDADGNVVTTKPLEKAVQAMMNLYFNGPGSNLRSASGTAWGAVNAVTHYLDHQKKFRSVDTKLNSLWFGGDGAKLKKKAVEVALAKAA